MSAIILSQRLPGHYIVQDSYLLKLVLSLFSGCFLCTFTFSHFQHCRSNQLCITMDNHQKTFECQKLFRNSSKTILTYCLTTILNWQFGPWPNKKADFSLLNIGNNLEQISDQMISVPSWYWDIGPIFLIERVTIPRIGLNAKFSFVQDQDCFYYKKIILYLFIVQVVVRKQII